jgi:hypothetical protein
VLHRYFIRPITVDRIRSSWIGDAIERYVAWLSERNYASRNVFVRVPPCSDSESLHRGLAPKPGRNFLAMLNLDTQLLIIQQTKFEKDRLVPFGPKMARAIAGFLDREESRFGPIPPDCSAFSFDKRKRTPIGPNTISWTFHKLLPALQLTVPSGVRPPHVHCLRHSFAVGTLLRWYPRS